MRMHICMHTRYVAVSIPTPAPMPLRQHLHSYVRCAFVCVLRYTLCCVTVDVCCVTVGVCCVTLCWVCVALHSLRSASLYFVRSLLVSYVTL